MPACSMRFWRRSLFGFEAKPRCGSEPSRRLRSTSHLDHAQLAIDGKALVFLFPPLNYHFDLSILMRVLLSMVSGHSTSTQRPLNKRQDETSLEKESVSGR